MSEQNESELTDIDTHAQPTPQDSLTGVVIDAYLKSNTLAEVSRNNPFTGLNLSHDRTGTLLTIRSGSFTVNDRLPPGVSIRPKKFFFGKSGLGPFAVVKNEIYLDEEKLLECKEVGAAALAHEIGHLIGQENPDEGKQLASLEGRALRAQGVDQVTAWSSYFNAKLQSEVEAWNHGKAVATEMGVDEMVYEDFMNYCLQSYYYDILQHLKSTVDTHLKDSSDFSMQLYNIGLQEVETVTYKDLIATFDQDKLLIRGKKVGQDIKEIRDRKVNDMRAMQKEQPFTPLIMQRTTPYKSKRRFGGRLR